MVRTSTVLYVTSERNQNGKRCAGSLCTRPEPRPLVVLLVLKLIFGGLD